MAFKLRDLFKAKISEPEPEPEREAAKAATPSSASFAEAQELIQAGRLEAALLKFDEFLVEEPLHSEAWYKRGNVLKDLARLEEAVASYARAIYLRPGYAAALCNRGVVSLRLGRTSHALEDFMRAVDADPHDTISLFNCALVYEALGQSTDAFESYGKTIALAPQHTGALINRGRLHEARGRWDEALADFERALALQPEAADIHFNRAAVLERLKRWSEAITSLDTALRIDPKHAGAYSLRGNLLMESQQIDAALRDHTQAIDLRPERADFHFHRAVVLERLGRWEEATDGYRQALALDGNYAAAHSNLGGVLMMRGDIAGAIGSYDRAIRADPELAIAHYNRALAKLLSGDLLDGFAGYEWRWKTGDPSFQQFGAYVDVPLWRGEQPLAGRSVLVVREQGFGDTLQFCRYIRLLADRGATVTFLAHDALVSLLKGVDGISEVVADASALTHFDFKCSLLSLPLAFRTTLDSIPAPKKYIHVDGQDVSRWQIRLGPHSRTRIGIAWSGSPKMQPYDQRRSMPLAKLLEYLPSEFEYFSLQKEIREDDMPPLASCEFIEHYAADFTDTAALCECMDLIISVDTSLVHLAGALGRPTWVLLPFMPDWRWLLDRDDSPWYPGAKLYRQAAVGDWDGVLRRVADDLRRRFQR
jgi:tetratricopeptide (TPR) repeat protein